MKNVQTYGYDENRICQDKKELLFLSLVSGKNLRLLRCARNGAVCVRLMSFTG